MRERVRDLPLLPADGSQLATLTVHREAFEQAERAAGLIALGIEAGEVHDDFVFPGIDLTYELEKRNRLCELESGAEMAPPFQERELCVLLAAELALDLGADAPGLELEGKTASRLAEDRQAAGVVALAQQPAPRGSEERPCLEALPVRGQQLGESERDIDVSRIGLEDQAEQRDGTSDLAA